MNQKVLNKLRARARQDVECGMEHGGVQGCSFAIAHGGEILWEEGFGAADADTPMLLLSITKTVVEAAMWVLYGEGLSPQTPVTDIMPDFMSGTAPEITLAMIETHTAGFPWQKLDFPACADRAARLEAFKSWRVEAPPGSRYEYHPITAGWVLAEVIERISGQGYRAFLRDRVLTPLGLSGVAGVSLGEPEDQQARTLRHFNCMGGWTPDPALRPPMAYGLDTLAGLALGVPGAGGVGTAGGVARLYQAYLHNPGDLWRKDVLDDARYVTRVQMPDFAGRPMQRSLSFVQAGAPEARYGERTFFGSTVSGRAFGHQGQGGQIAWADPATGLSFCYLTNTVVFPPGGCFHPRARELSSIAATLLS